MNTGPTDTRSPHLDLADLIAEVNGQPISAQARGHLANCEHCRTEADRWNLVADGVRSLAADAPPAAAPVRPRHAGLRVLVTNPRRRPVLAASAAAALVILAGAGYGVTAALTSASSGPVLTAVTGCASLEQASGTLEQVNGSSLVIKTASGQPVTVTTTARTKVAESAGSGALLGDITNGAVVTVLGPSYDGTVAASSVVIANLAHQELQLPPGMVAVEGTVSDADNAGFTVVASDGTRTPVTTSGETIIAVPNASLGQLPVGATIVAIGSARPDGTLSGAAVAAVFGLPQSGQNAPNGQIQVHVSAHASAHPSGQPTNCSPASIANTLAFGV
jgi:hypothetical protein